MASTKNYKKYSKHQLDTLADKLKLLDYRGLANTVKWLNVYQSQGLEPEYEDILFNVKHEDLPLYINHPIKAVAEIAKWRLKINK